MANAKKTENIKADDTIKRDLDNAGAEMKNAASDIRDAAATAAGRVTEGAREFVRRTAATGQERTDAVYESVESYNDGLESAMKRVVDGYVSVLGFAAKAAHEDATRAFATMGKLAEAKSVTEAMRIQGDYIRQNTTAQVERVRDAGGAVRDVAMDGFQAARDNVTTMWPYGKKAA